MADEIPKLSFGTNEYLSYQISQEDITPASSKERWAGNADMLANSKIVLWHYDIFADIAGRKETLHRVTQQKVGTAESGIGEPFMLISAVREGKEVHFIYKDNGKIFWVEAKEADGKFKSEPPVQIEEGLSWRHGSFSKKSGEVELTLKLGDKEKRVFTKSTGKAVRKIKEVKKGQEAVVNQEIKP
jgi:hypothetical protein